MENLEEDNNDQGEKDSAIAAFTECIIPGCSNHYKNERSNGKSNHETRDGMEKEPTPGTLNSREEVYKLMGKKHDGSWEEDGEDPLLEVGKEAEVVPLVLHNDVDSSMQNKSNEKRMLDTLGEETDHDPTPKHGYNSQKYKQGECSGVESEFGSAVSPLECNTDLFNAADDKCGSGKQEGGGSGSSGKRRLAEWGGQARANEESIDDTRSGRRRKSRWLNADMQMKLLGPLQLPNFMDESVLDFDADPEILGLKTELADINSKLKKPVLVDKRQEEQSPSPDPVFNDVGIRINTHEAGVREKLHRKRRAIISDLVKKHPTFKLPPRYKPSRLFKKLYIPVKQYPEYDFVGSILGYRGDSQKRIEKETGARISLRGAGSSRKRKHVSNNDDLHVLIEADDENSLDAAVRMVEKLLVPIKNSGHKRARLGEIAPGNADLNGDARPSVSPASPPVLIEKGTHLPGSQNFTLTPSSSVSSLSGLSGASSLSSFSSYSDWFPFSSPCIMSKPHNADCSGFNFTLYCGSPSTMQIPPVDFFHTSESTVKRIVCPTYHTQSRTK